MNRSTSDDGGHASAGSNGRNRRPCRTAGRTPAPRRSGGRESGAALAARGAAVARRLAETYPRADCSLRFRSPFQLLIATILSAQCTDKRVNAVTGPLFRRWPTPAALAAARRSDVESAIRSTGFFRAKARSVIGCCQALVDRHAGRVPRELEPLVKLPGVGRKTANVVLGSAFGIPSGVVVDTHVGRISRRLGLTRHTDAVRAERDLAAVVPREHWIAFSHRLIEHGRTICTARCPTCETCPLADLCPRIGMAAMGRLPRHRVQSAASSVSHPPGRHRRGTRA